MSRYKVSPAAQRDLDSIWDFIANAAQNPDVANRQLETLFDRIKLLASQPFMGQVRDDLAPNVRSFSAGSYVILYRPAKDGIDVIAVVHGSRDWPRLIRESGR